MWENISLLDRDLGELLVRSRLGGETFRSNELKSLVGENYHHGEISLELFPRLRGIIFLIWTAPKVTSLKFKDYKRIPPITFYAPGHTNPHQAMPTHIRPRQPTPTHTRLYQPTPVHTSPHQVTSGHTYTVQLVQLN